MSRTGANQGQGDLRVGLESDAGQSRKRNEDYAAYLVPEDQARRQQGALFVVADGMGGHRAGEIASRRAVERLMGEYYAVAGLDAGQGLQQAFGAANQAVYELAQSDPGRSGMGTTLVAAVIQGRQVTVANVGDSRAYLVGRRGIEQITRDHSWVEEQVQAGLLTAEQAARHPQRHVISRALGTRASVQVDLFRAEMGDGDVLLLCTDGLNTQVPDRQIDRVVRSGPPSQAAARLIARANARGGKDNVSVVVVQAGPAPTPAPQPWWRPAQDWLQSLASSEAVAAAVVPVQNWLQRVEPRHRWALGLLAGICLCLCAMVCGLVLLGAGFVGDPAAAPRPATIRYQDLAGQDLERLAIYLGYDGLEAMRQRHPGQGLGRAATASLWPSEPGIFVVGPVEAWQCDGPACTFRLEMAGEAYLVRCNSQFLAEGYEELAGERVRVFGYWRPGPRGGGGSVVEARAIDRGSRWWSFWPPPWETVYRWPEGGDAEWVYTVADPNPYNPVTSRGFLSELDPAEQVLLRGRWGSEAFLRFEAASVFRLVGGHYEALSGEAFPTPQPTATLRPTATVGGD